MLGYLLTLLGLLCLAATAFWWVRRGYRSQRRMRNEVVFARDKLAGSVRQLTADLHQTLSDSQESGMPNLCMEASSVLLATDKQDGTLYALVPFDRIGESGAGKFEYVLLARWSNGRWIGTPIVKQDCSVREALDQHVESLAELN